MIIYCGDSFVWDDGKPDNWTNLLTKKLKMNSINLATQGCSNEYIFQYQLINKVLPLLSQSPKMNNLLISENIYNELITYL